MTARRTLLFTTLRRWPRLRLANPFDMSVYRLDDLGLSSALPAEEKRHRR